MGFKKQAIAALSIVSLLAASIGSVNFASAGKYTDMLETMGGGSISSVVTTCAEAQQTINSVNSIGEVTISFTENCSMDLRIPSGKKIALNLQFEHEGEEGYYPPSFFNASGDNITVEEGATLYLESGPIEVLGNHTEGKSIINNMGIAYITDMRLDPSEGAYTFTNSGELNVQNVASLNTKIRNAEGGKIRLAGGWYKNPEEAMPYIVGEPKMDESGELVHAWAPDDTTKEYRIDPYEQGLEVGTSFKLTSNYPEFWNAYGKTFYSTDESVVAVAGSNTEGWTFTVVGVGEAEIRSYETNGSTVNGKITGYRQTYEQPTTPAVTCAEAQNAINNINQPNHLGYSEVRIAENCAANLTIPSGKKIMLSLYSVDEYDGPAYHTLTNLNDGDTITVEEGATLFLMGFSFYDDLPNSVATVTNSTNGRSIIRNYGTVRVGTNLTAENGAYLVENSGKLYTVGGVYTGGAFRDVDSGRTYIASGIFNNIDNIRQYIVDGMKLDESTGKIVSALPDGREPIGGLYDALLHGEHKLPVGYSFTVGRNYADYADAIELAVTSSDDEGHALEVSGSNQEGWTLSVVGVGHACIGVQTLGSAGSDSCITGYVAPSNAVDTNESLTKYLVDKFIEVIRQAIENGKIISIDINVRAMTGASVEAESAIQQVIGNDTLIDYYDVSLALNGDGKKLTDVHDLEGKDVEVHIPATFLNRLEAVKSGYTRNYYVVRYHDGVAEKINAKLDGDDLVFKSSKFSTYAVAYTDTKTTSGGGSSSGSHTGTSGSSNSSFSSNTNNTNNSSNSNNASNSGNNTGTNGSSNGLGAPDTGVASYLNNGNATVATASIVVVSAIASGVLAYKAISKKQRREK